MSKPDLSQIKADLAKLQPAQTIFLSHELQEQAHSGHLIPDYVLQQMGKHGLGTVDSIAALHEAMQDAARQIQYLSLSGTPLDYDWPLTLSVVGAGPSATLTITTKLTLEENPK